MTPTHLPRKSDVVTAVSAYGTVKYATSDAHLSKEGFIRARRTAPADLWPNQVRAEINRIEHGRSLEPLR